MTAERFHIEAGHIMMFARSIGDPNPLYDPTCTPLDALEAPPTFVQASAQFDPDYYLRPAVGGDGWFGSGGQPTGAIPTTGSGGSGGGLHAEQHFEIHRPLEVGMVLTASVRPGESWEKESRRGGRLIFGERITEYRDADGVLVVTARSVGVQTDGAVIR